MILPWMKSLKTFQHPFDLLILNTPILLLGHHEFNIEKFFPKNEALYLPSFLD